MKLKETLANPKWAEGYGRPHDLHLLAMQIVEQLRLVVFPRANDWMVYTSWTALGHDQVEAYVPTAVEGVFEVCRKLWERFGEDWEIPA